MRRRAARAGQRSQAGARPRRTRSRRPCAPRPGRARRATRTASPAARARGSPTGRGGGGVLTSPGVARQPRAVDATGVAVAGCRRRPAPTATIRSPSTRRGRRRTPCPRASTVAIAQPSMTSALMRAASDALGGEAHGVEDLLVAGAAAQVAGQRLADLRVARRAARARSRSWPATIRPGVQKPHCTAPASTNACCTGCSSLAVGQPLDRDDLAPLGLAGEHQAGADERAVEVDRAGAALALLAGVLGARQAEPLAQHVEQALALPDVVGLAPLAVDRAAPAASRGLPPVLVPGPLRACAGPARRRAWRR